MTLGIRPTKPHTGFGYIEKGEVLDSGGSAFAVGSFKEKPERRRLKSMWNLAAISGMRAFLFFAPTDIAGACSPRALCCRGLPRGLCKRPKGSCFLCSGRSGLCQGTEYSIDYAVMERASDVGVVEASFDWSDVGSWSALWDIGDKDQDGKVVLGDVVALETQNSYIRSESRLVAVLGLRNVVVVETPDAVLVADKNRVEDVKAIVDQLKAEGRSESHSHQKVGRPWGFYESLDNGERFQVKRITVKPRARLSLQMHHHRAEHWIVVSGTARSPAATRSAFGAERIHLYSLGRKHQLENQA
jgi:mannose-1-phosphate guanylyltransferase